MHFGRKYFLQPQGRKGRKIRDFSNSESIGAQTRMQHSQEICEALKKKNNKNETYSEMSRWRLDSECLIILRSGWEFWRKR